jgi:ribonuclease M5
LIKLDCPVIVEGKYDKITLENVIDALIIPTNGFSVFKDSQKRDLIRLLAKEKGVIVMTDSDNAGNLIRAYIKKIVGDSKIINVYVPSLKGKEKRKTKASKEGLLGVEGMSPEMIEEALKRSGVIGRKVPRNTRKITKNDMYLLGLSGRDNSALKRKRLLKKMELPESLSSSAMIDIVNTLYTYEEFIGVIENAEEI